MQSGDDTRLKLPAPDHADQRSAYEAPAAFDAGPAEQHTHGPTTNRLDNPDGSHQGYTNVET